MKFVQVAVEAPLKSVLTYSLPLDMQTEDLLGRAVKVPLGSRQAQGVVIDFIENPVTPEGVGIKNISEVLTEYPPLPAHYREWLLWLSKYYMHPPGQVTSLAYPPLSSIGARKTRKSEILPQAQVRQEPTLTEEQAHVLQEIKSKSGFGVHLLFGVTGSGKTEVYLQLLKDTLARGEQAIVLVPEISLTPQMIQRFTNRFGQNIAVYHSHLTPREKTNQWWEMVTEGKQILIGARSALFCPLPKLGLIIIDEEHEPSFKQEETFKYHARDAAIMLAKTKGCPIVLGSATPSLESWNNAKEKKYSLHTMKHRVEHRPMPLIELVDLRELKLSAQSGDKKEDQPAPWLSPQLYQKIKERLEKREQTALFINRRGMAPTVLCGDCGKRLDCPNCSVALTLHGKSNLICHYCDYRQTLPRICPECKDSELKALGIGTESIEQDLAKLFPDARIERADRDNITSREELEDIIQKMESNQIDILIGTQMIAKGLDFENLTLVGFIVADIGFNLPDFRAAERSFQLLMQMGGRAGRHPKPDQSPGEVLLQTFNCEHSSVQHALHHDYVGFAEQELALRKELFYPPTGRIACLRLQSTQQSHLHRAGEQIVELAQRWIQKDSRFAHIEVLGPAESPFSKLKGKFRHQILIKSSQHASLNALCEKLLEPKFQGVKISVDIDPINML
ncbi:MAG: primosomal protein N' [Bdellovibrionales bacterium]